jgi:Heparinase II/III-like protein/Heparinase II/III N-terminus
VASQWQRKLSRLAGMSWDEIRTRLGQEISKRSDLTLHRAGFSPFSKRTPVRTAAPARFFFGNGENEAAHRATLLQSHLPVEAERILHEADHICRHEFSLLGYENLDYGSEIDWHLDPVHGKRSPLRPWFKINFLDFDEVGDHKIIWELNRHQHLVTLAKAWCLTGDRVYSSELVTQWYSWQKANPYPLGINWASSLEVAFRSLSWLWLRSLLEGCADFTADFQKDLSLALQVHGHYIERYLSTYFSPNTHLLGEAVALFFIGTLCPEIFAAERWRIQGWKILLEELNRQVRPDGVYFEQALYYHVYALDFFLHARHLAGENALAIPEAFDQMLKRMLDVVQALSEFGPCEGFGDDDGGRLFSPRRNQIAHMTDPLAIGAVLYGCSKYSSAGPTEEAIWLFGDKAIKAADNPRPQKPATSKGFSAGGIYLITDDTPWPQQMMIDAGPQGTSRSGHGHADALSLRFALNRRRFLVDAGTYSYMEGKQRDRFRGTAAHNTLTVDGLDQAVPDGPFAWNSIPTIKAETWRNGQTFDYFVGSHDGYRRLDDALLHRRFVFHPRGGFWLVRDLAEGNGTHQLETFWHFAPEIELRKVKNMILAEHRRDDGNAENARMALLLDQASAWTTEIAEGLVSRSYGSKQVAPAVRAWANVRLPQDCAVLLQPAGAASDVGTFAAIGSDPASQVRGYRYQNVQRTEFVFLGQGDRPWVCGPWSSDASLLYCRVERARFTHVIMISGSFAEWSGKRFVSLPSNAETFEWLNRDGERTAFSPDSPASTDSVVGNFEIFDSVP